MTTTFNGLLRRYAGWGGALALGGALSGCGGNEASGPDAAGGDDSASDGAADSSTMGPGDANDGDAVDVAPGRGSGGDSGGIDSGSDSGRDSGDDSGRDAGTDGGIDTGPRNQLCSTFTATGDTIVDLSTNLTWRRKLYGQPTWAQAVTLCTAWGGRLPTESELTNLIAPAKACSPQITWPFPPSGEGVWSSTSPPGVSNTYYTVYFDGTPPVPNPDVDGHWAWCVR